MEVTDLAILKPFKNLPISDFSNPVIEKKMNEALKKVESDFGKEYDIVIGGKRYKSKRKIKSINPSKINEIVGITNSATEELAELAIQEA